MKLQKDNSICVSVFKTSNEPEFLRKSMTEKWIELIHNLEKSKHTLLKK